MGMLLGCQLSQLAVKCIGVFGVKCSNSHVPTAAVWWRVGAVGMDEKEDLVTVPGWGPRDPYLFPEQLSLLPSFGGAPPCRLP